ncbi:uncharacterized protein CDAR_505091 [Caerostris darwini]|uniref:Gustatory receptor n=1 Tax=Caerostris darwini TaxID=1538125 RepID=A0AAV4MH40_9ARAC|nr:uncharacterized protein CDAR_505091 [Caerostris darwini]
MRDLFNHLLQQLNDDHSIEEMRKLIESYESTATTMRSMDDCFSIPTILVTLLNLFGLFWSGYRLAFVTSVSAYEICPVFYHLSHHLLLMIFASMTNEKAAEAKLIIRYVVRHFYPEIRRKIKCKSNIVLENNLTLWKIYVFDRSLIITSFGCLLTYGILLATLGKEP